MPDLARAYLFGQGMASDFRPACVFSRPGRAPNSAAGLQLLFNAAPMTAHPYFSPFQKPYPDGFACCAVRLRPESVRFASADPRAALTIRQNFLAAPTMTAVLRDGIRLVAGCRVLKRPWRRSSTRSWRPGRRRPAIDAHIRATGITVHHPLGTCRMGRASERVRRRSAASCAGDERVADVGDALTEPSPRPAGRRPGHEQTAHCRGPSLVRPEDRRGFPRR